MRQDNWREFKGWAWPTGMASVMDCEEQNMLNGGKQEFWYFATPAGFWLAIVRQL